MVGRLRIEGVKATRIASLERTLYAVIARCLASIAFLARLDDAIAAATDLAGVRAAIVVDRISIVTNLMIWIHAAIIRADFSLAASIVIGTRRKGTRVPSRGSNDPIAATSEQAAIGAVIGINGVLVLAVFKAFFTLCEIRTHQAITALRNNAAVDAVI